MIKLIVLENDTPIFNPEVKMFIPFRRLIERDKGGKITDVEYEKGDTDGRRKYRAIKELAFIYWFADPRSPYREQYTNLKDREKSIKLKVGLDERWKIDEDIQAAIDFYEQEVKDDYDIRSIDDAIIADSKTGEYLRNVDYSQTIKGKPIYDPLHISKIIATRAGVVEALRILRNKVLNGEAVSRTIRGGGTVNRYEE